MFINRLQQRKDASPAIRDLLLREYQERITSFGKNGETEDRAELVLRMLVAEVADCLEELELRQHAGEFDADQLKEETTRRRLSQPVKDLMKMMASLDVYRETIETLTGGGGITGDRGMESQGEADEQAKLDSKAIDRVLDEFDGLNLFAEFQEGDAVYDQQYRQEDLQVLNQLFFDILDGYLEPLVVGFRAVMGGNNSQKLFAALLASIRPLRQSAETMGFQDLRIAFQALESILKQAQETGNMIAADRIHFVRAYSELTRNLPNAGKDMGLMDLFDTDSLPDSMILHFIGSPSVEGWMIQALLEIGITDRKQLHGCTVEDVRAVTGLPFDQCRELLHVCRRELQKMS